METISQVRQQGAYLLLYRPSAGVYFNPWLKFHFYVRGMAGQVRVELRAFSQKKFVKSGNFLDFFLFLCTLFNTVCFICRLSESTVSLDTGIEPRTVATST
jgi:hypothetical protein